MAPADSFRQLPSILPQLRKWVADIVGSSQGDSQSALSVVDAEIRACFPPEFLRRSRVVLTDEVPKPPLNEFGLPGANPLGDAPLDGIALGTTYFVRPSASPEVHFHELVHLAQWRRLGTDNFLLAYGVGLVTQGYRNSPLEGMAQQLQLEYRRRVHRMRLVEYIELRTDAIWQDARKQLQAVGVNTVHSIHSDWITGG